MGNIFIERDQYAGYVMLKKFLLFNPKYNSMTDKAKILYAYLEAELNDTFKEDEEGYVYLENTDMDNERMKTALNCNQSKLENAMEELEKYNLIEKSEPNKIYLLRPNN